MKKIRVLFYVTPKFKWKYRINWLISLWTRSKYSHCEIHTPDANEQFGVMWVDGHYEAFGDMYTSTMRGDHNGTVKRPASEVLDKPEHWEYIEVEACDSGYAYMVHWMDDAVACNKGYSMWDLLKFASPIHFPDNNRNICSEFCNDALWYILCDWKGGIISPKKLHKKLSKLGYETKELA
jgi:hypothetical protein